MLSLPVGQVFNLPWTGCNPVLRISNFNVDRPLVVLAYSKIEASIITRVVSDCESVWGFHDVAQHEEGLQIADSVPMIIRMDVAGVDEIAVNHSPLRRLDAEILNNAFR